MIRSHLAPHACLDRVTLGRRTLLNLRSAVALLEGEQVERARATLDWSERVPEREATIDVVWEEPTPGGVCPDPQALTSELLALLEDCAVREATGGALAVPLARAPARRVLPTVVCPRTRERAERRRRRSLRAAIALAFAAGAAAALAFAAQAGMVAF